MATTKDQVKQLQNELNRLRKRSLNQRDAWRIVGGMVYRRLAVDWFQRALGLRTKGGGPRENPWRALKSESYIRYKLKRRKTGKLVLKGTFRQSYGFEAFNNHAIVGIQSGQRKKAGWLEGMGFEVLCLEKDIINRSEKILIDFIWNK